MILFQGDQQVNKNFELKVGDFGLSRFNVESQSPTLQKLVGTFSYCAPERYERKRFESSADVYSSGVILWELVMRCLSGKYQRPFGEFKDITIDFQVIIQVSKNGLRPSIPSLCPKPMEELIRKMWDQDPTKRPTCSQLLQELDDLEKVYENNEEEWNENTVAFKNH